MSIASLSHCRAVLLRVIARLGVDDLDYRAFPDTKSNGEILLHIAGFEFLMIACGRAAKGQSIEASRWPTLKGGFAREAGFAPPERRALDDYLECLTAVRAMTTALLTDDDQTSEIRADSFPIGKVAGELSATDREGDEDCYRRLAAAVTSSFNDDGAANPQGMIDIASVLLLHESYHRGQITLNKYFRSRILRAVPPQAGS